MSVGAVALGIGLGVAGIAVTLLTFWLAYRKTIGAKQERIRTANADITATVLKRILLEDLTPSYDDLSHFVAGKAIAARLDITDLCSIHDLALVLWAGVFENDLVPSDRRRAILSSAFPIEKVAREQAPPPVRDAGDDSRVPARGSPTLIRQLAFSAAVLGIAVSVIPVFFLNRHAGAGVLIPILAIVASATLTATVLIYRIGTPKPGGSNPQELERLTTYPDPEEGLESLRILRELSPLAISSLTSFATDEQRTLKDGGTRGLFLRTGSTPWHIELLNAALVEETDPPPDIDSQGRQFVALTEKGRVVARLILARQTVPAWLASAIAAAGHNGLDDDPRVTGNTPSVPTGSTPE